MALLARQDTRETGAERLSALLNPAPESHRAYMQIERLNVCTGLRKPLSGESKLPSERDSEPPGPLVELLTVPPDEYLDLTKSAIDAHVINPAPSQRKLVPHLLHEVAKMGLDVTLELLPRSHHDFRRGRRRRGAQISHEIGDRKIGLMPDARNDRNFRCGDCAGQALLVERPEVLKRPAPAREDQNLRKLYAIEVPQGSCDLAYGALALNLYGIELDMDIGESALKNTQNISNRRSGR